MLKYLITYIYRCVIIYALCPEEGPAQPAPQTTSVPRLGCISDLAAFVSGSVKYQDTFLKSNMEPQIFEKNKSFERKPP